ncbi:MAG: hypothetical protein R3F43_19005 [bacterium]
MPVSLDRLASAGFSPRLVRTWSPTLVRDLRLLVPVHVDALLVGGRGTRVADCRLRDPGPLAEGEPPPVAFDLLPPPFADRQRAPGVHLHWALPDALARLDTSNDPPVIPTAPDRWLVLRLSAQPNQPGRRLVTGFVLRSDGRAVSPPVPLDQWVEPGPAAEPLTALGGGDPAWAGYYDNCLNRLAFHDDLRDVAPGPLAYLVCGWHADPAQDPLAAIRTRAALGERLAALGWSAEGFDLDKAAEKSGSRLQAAVQAGLTVREVVEATALRASLADHAVETGRFLRPPDPVPRACLYHGAVVNVRSDRAGGEGPPAAASLRVVIGQSGPEALGTLVADQAVAPTLARVVAALALGGLDELDAPDGRAQVDDRLHEAAFGAMSLDPPTIERIWQSPAEGYRVPDPPSRPTKGRPGAVDERIRDLSQNFDLRFGASPQPRVQIADRVVFGSAWSRPRRPKLTAGYVNVERAAPRFYVPAEPTILIQGGARSFKHGGDGRFDAQGLLRCRVTGGCVDELAARIQLRDRTPVRGEDVLAGGADHGGVPPECQELLEELVLLDPGSAEAIARRGVPQPALGRRVDRAALARMEAQVVAGAEVVRTEQTAWWALRNPAVDASLLNFSGLKGTLPSPVGLRPSGRPWVPMHLDWEIELLPAADGMRAWQPGEIDFEPVADASGPARLFAGRCVLAGGLAQALKETAREVIDQAARSGGTEVVRADVQEDWHSEDARVNVRALAGVTSEAAEAQGLEDVVAALGGMDVLTGSLDGLLYQLRAHVSPEPAEAMDKPADFLGFTRAASLRRLRLVDAFGQILDLVTPDATLSTVRWTESLATDDPRQG